MLWFDCRLDSASASAALGRVADASSAAAVNAVAAHAVLNLCKAHLIRKNLAGMHKFWGEAAESARAESGSDSARVVIPRQGMRWQRFGGTHRAKPGGAIAVPLRGEDRGVWPSEKLGPRGADPDVFVWRRPSSGKAFLGRREGPALRLYYILLKSVSKGPDRSVLPSDAEIHASARAAVYSHLARARKRNP